MIALRLAELPPLSQPTLRFVLLAAAVTVWIAWTVGMTRRDDVRPEHTAPSVETATPRDFTMFAIVMLAFVPYVYGVRQLDWGFNELSGLFLVAGFAVGLTS
ncbi:MAG: hypothetical protein ACYC3L_11550, partial [Gemmatimonadaceae bacterium]